MNTNMPIRSWGEKAIHRQEIQMASKPVQMACFTNKEKRCKFKTLKFDFSTYQLTRHYL